jgi:protein CpxP
MNKVKNMFKIFQSKLFRYGAIAGLVVASSGAVLAINQSANVSANTGANTDLNSQLIAKSKTQTDLKSDIQQNNLGELNQLAELAPENFAERPNLLPSGRLLKQLNLSDDQWQKLKEIGDRDRGSLREMGQKVKQGHRELRELLASNEGSDRIRAKHDQLLNLQTELRQKHFERMLSMRDVLTPEQRSQLNQLMQKNRPMRDGMRERLEKRLDRRDQINS